MQHAVLALAFPFLVLAAGCGDVEVTRLAPDSARTGAIGSLGRYGVLEVTRPLSSDAGSVDTDVYRPFLDDVPPPAAPAFVFVQGGFVATERYAWIAEHVASRGFVALVPHTLFDLAFFSQDAPAQALAGARHASADPNDPLFGLVDAQSAAVIAGHSLGGVVAAKSWRHSSSSDIGSLVLLASEPDPADDFTDQRGRVVSIAGSRDTKETVARAVAGARAFPHADVVVVDGMTHYQFTDDATKKELATDASPRVDSAIARARALAFVDAVLDEAAARAPYPFDDAASWPAGTRAP